MIHEDIEGLGLGTELGALEVAPAVAHGAQLARGAIGLGDFLRSGQRRLVVHVKADEHEILGHQLLHA